NVASHAVILPFIPLVLALAGSVTAQSVSLTVQALRGRTPTRKMLLSLLKFELATGALLGVACAVIVAMAVFIWKGDVASTLGLLISIVASLTCAALLGLAMPHVLRIFSRNPQVAAGPVALATADAV